MSYRRRAARKSKDFAQRALDFTRRQFMVPKGRRFSLDNGLTAPKFDELLSLRRTVIFILHGAHLQVRMYVWTAVIKVIKKVIKYVR